MHRWRIFDGFERSATGGDAQRQGIVGYGVVGEIITLGEAA